MILVSNQISMSVKLNWTKFVEMIITSYLILVHIVLTRPDNPIKPLVTFGHYNYFGSLSL